MVKIAVLGSTGMLGNAVSKHFMNIGYEVITTYRNEKVSFGENVKAGMDGSRTHHGPQSDPSPMLKTGGPTGAQPSPFIH